MPPQADETTMIVDHHDDNAASYSKNVTFAINYEVSLVDEFVASPHHRQRRVMINSGTPHVETIPESTTTHPNNLIMNCTNNNTPSNNHHDATTASSSNKDESSSSSFNSENSAPNSSEEDNNNNSDSSSSRIHTRSQQPPPTNALTTTTQSDHKTHHRRTSSRGQQGKRRDAALARTRVRYDMQIVPPVHRNQAFLDMFPLWWMPASSSVVPPPPPQRIQPSRRKFTTLSSSSSLDYPACNTCVPPPSLPSPFSENTSVVWIPSKRTEWEDSVSEMTAVCTSAALHRHRVAVAAASANGQQRSSNNANNKPFHPPLSRDYIRDRVDIDDPLLGYQIRHKTGGWLQGFCLWTNFTTWTHYFKWDSLHEQSGMVGNYPSITNNYKIDRDGSLAQELEALPREGDPMGGGIVFSAIAEIGLVGALGCGEYLLRMALDGIREKKQYRFVVLQATDSSKAFYERFGFVRVGAICKYYVGSAAANSGGSSSAEEQPIVGYRHWTHANESDASLQMHGGPSYMMCLKLPPPIDDDSSSSLDVGVCPRCQRPASVRTTKPSSVLQAMLTALEVDEKPTIEQLGGTSTPALCRTTTQRRNSKAAASISSFTIDQQTVPSPNVVKKKVRVVAVPKQPVAPPQRSAAAAPSSSKRKASPTVPARTIVNPTLPRPPTTSTSSALKRRLSTRSMSSFASSDPPPAKKFKPSGSVENTPREVLLSPPPEGKPLTYAQKQYQSIWLAVPPDDVKTVCSKSKSRPPPKPRLSLDTTITSTTTTGEPSAKPAATSETKTTEAVNQQASTTTVIFLDKTATEQASSTKAAVAQSQLAGDASSVGKEVETDKPPSTRDVPRRAAATAAAAAVAASSVSALKKVEGSKKSNVAAEASSTSTLGPNNKIPSRNSSARADKSPKIPTPPTRELPKRAATMQKPPPPAITTAARKDSQRKTAPARARSRSKKSPKPASKEERLFYSVRGPDGRFVRVPIGSIITYTASVKTSSKSAVSQTSTKSSSLPSPATATSLANKPSTSKKITIVKVKRADGRRSKPAAPPSAPTVTKIKSVDRSELRKQKVHSYPRTREHFYNRVVKPKDGKTKNYFFVLNYNEDAELLRLVPMEAKNKLTGQREGRPRYQCVIGDTDANFVTVSANDYQVVAATMVMKTPFVALEAWDIEDD